MLTAVGGTATVHNLLTTAQHVVHALAGDWPAALVWLQLEETN
jgi:hypothetical protein